MKTHAKQFAQALYDATRDVSEKEAEQIIKKFVFLLGKNGLVKRMNQVIQEYEKYSREKEGRIFVEAESARDFSADEEKNILLALEKITGKKIEWKLLVSPELLGGVRLNFSDRMFDGTLKAQIEGLRAHLTQN